MGKDRSGLYEPAVQEYAKRLSHYTRLELVELTETSFKKSSAGQVAKDREAEKILEQLTPQASLVALDERGKLLTSIELSEYVARAQNQSRDLVFAIGGDEGLSPAVTGKAALTLSLSKMTLPHRLARVVLLEQLYRAYTLIRGEPYHKK